MRKKSSIFTGIQIAAVIMFFGFAGNIGIVETAYAAPIISSVTDTLTVGQLGTIKGIGFGTSGPNVHFYDDFESGTVGLDLKTGIGSAVIGQWDILSNVHPKYSSDTSVSGVKAWKVTGNGVANDSMAARIALPGVSEIYMSWWNYVPTNSLWSGEGNTNASGMNWKIMWLMQGISTDNDLTYTMAGGTELNPAKNIFVRGNNTPLAYPNTEAINFVMNKGEWHRFAWWLKDGSNSNGSSSLWELRNTGMTLLKDIKNASTINSGAVRNYLWVNGFVRDLPVTTQMFDDVYVATGPNSRARIEIGTGCTGGVYTACTNLAISTPNSWTDGVITFTARLGSLSSGPAHLFVINGNGDVSAGTPITITKGSAAAPMGLRVTAIL